jgi:hypothetical protein
VHLIAALLPPKKEERKKTRLDKQKARISKP